MAILYIGDSNNKPRKVKNFYIGDSDNKPRKVKRAYIGDSNNKPRLFYKSSLLPNDYQAVEYIFNDGGTEYIDLGFKPNSDYKISIDFKITRPSSWPGDFPIFGVMNIYYEAVPYIGYETVLYPTYILYDDTPNSSSSSNDKLYCRFGGTSGHDVRYVTPSYNTNYNVLMNSDKNFYINSNFLFNTERTFSATAKNALLFGANWRWDTGVGDDQGWLIKKFPQGLYVYHFEAWNGNGTKIRDMYPCYKKSNNTIGMLDIANSSNNFYTNQGTGTFSKGPNIDL